MLTLKPGLYLNAAGRELSYSPDAKIEKTGQIVPPNSAKSPEFSAEKGVNYGKTELSGALFFNAKRRIIDIVVTGFGLRPCKSKVLSGVCSLQIRGERTSGLNAHFIFGKKQGPSRRKPRTHRKTGFDS